MNQAAQEHNVDVRFLSRYEGEPGPAQVDALRGEWEAEADGVVLIPVDGTLLAAGLREAPSTLAVAVVGPELKGADVGCYISSDPAEMGRQLADAIIADGQSACTVYLSRGAGEAASQRYQGLVTRLLERRIACEQVTVDPEEDFALPDGRAAVALEPEMTQALCRAAAGTSQVYGVGASNQLLHDLEEGKAAALAVQSDYDAGLSQLVERDCPVGGGAPGKPRFGVLCGHGGEHVYRPHGSDPVPHRVEGRGHCEKTGGKRACVGRAPAAGRVRMQRPGQT